MKIINLDKFKVTQQVQIGDEVFDVYGIPVGNYIEDDPIAKIDEDKDPKGQVLKMIDLLGQYSNIPKNVLKKQNYRVLAALLLVIQGIDPNKLDESDGGAKSEADSKK